MGVNNPNNQLFGFPNSYLVNGATQNLSRFFSIGGTGFGAATLVASGYRSGDRLIGNGYIVFGTTVAALGWIQLPAGLTVATDTSSWSAQTRYFGKGYLVVQGGALTLTGASLQYVLFLDETNKDRLYLANRAGSNTFLQDNGSSLAAALDRIAFTFDIPIAQWQT